MAAKPVSLAWAILCSLVLALARAPGAQAERAALVFKTQLESAGELRVLGARGSGAAAFEPGRFGSAFRADSAALTFPGVGALLEAGLTVESIGEHDRLFYQRFPSMVEFTPGWFRMPRYGAIMPLMFTSLTSKPATAPQPS